MRIAFLSVGVAVAWAVLALPAVPGQADKSTWQELSAGEQALKNFTMPTGWQLAESVGQNADNARQLAITKPGLGVLINNLKGARDLLTTEKHADSEAHIEFMIPKGSNSGVKFLGLYEIQIVDSAGAKELTGDTCGGIYPRAEDQPKYHHIDKGTPPKVNACKPAGEWQSLDVVFQAPRFDADGKKTANAKFVKVVLNDQVIHENAEVLYPTGAAWRLKKELASGPLLLQGDHGPVAFRNVKVRAWKPEK
jgi:hypothetical protein